MHRSKPGVISSGRFTQMVLLFLAVILMLLTGIVTAWAEVEGEDDAPDEAPADGWFTDEDGCTFYYEGGKRLCADRLFETYLIGDRYYCFDEDGVLQRSCIRQINGNSYFFGEEGAMLFSTVWRDEDGELYLFLSDGRMLDHEEEASLADADGNVYWYRAEEGGKLYCNEELGVKLADGTKGYTYYNQWGRRANGITERNGTKYYYSETGILQPNTRIDLDGVKIRTDGSGKILDDEDEDDEESNDGKDPDKDCEEKTEGGNGGTGSGSETGSGEQRENSSSDPPKSGWGRDADGHICYYRDGETVKSALLRAEGGSFWLTEDGHLLTDAPAEAFIDGKMYRIRAKSDGTLYQNEFSLDRDGAREYYYGANCFAVTGLQEIDGIRYFFGSDGKIVRGRTFAYTEPDPYREAVYYADSSGRVFITGWNGMDGGRCYLREDGSLIVGNAEIDGTLYRFGDDGVLLGACLDGEYLTDENGQVLPDGLVIREEGVYYVDPETHAVVRDETVVLDAERYYFGSDGLLRLTTAESWPGEEPEPEDGSHGQKDSAEQPDDTSAAGSGTGNTSEDSAIALIENLLYPGDEEEELRNEVDDGTNTGPQTADYGNARALLPAAQSLNGQSGTAGRTANGSLGTVFDRKLTAVSDPELIYADRGTGQKQKRAGFQSAFPLLSLQVLPEGAGIDPDRPSIRIVGGGRRLLPTNFRHTGVISLTVGAETVLYDASGMARLPGLYRFGRIAVRAGNCGKIPDGHYAVRAVSASFADTVISNELETFFPTGTENP